MSLRSMIDSEFPAGIPVGVTVTAFYLDAPGAARPWPFSDVLHIGTRYRLPVWVARPGHMSTYSGTEDASAAAGQLRALGVPAHKIPARRLAVALDMETAVSVAYVSAFMRQLGKEGYATMPYGSASTIFANPAGVGRWVAQWTGERAQAAGKNVVATQWTNNGLGGYDLSVISSRVKLWDQGPTWARRALAEVAAVGAANLANFRSVRADLAALARRIRRGPS